MANTASRLGILLAAASVLASCAADKSANPLSPTIAGPIPGVEITAPTPVQPSVGAKVAVDQQPITLTVQNASTSGVRPLNYLFEVATDAQFANKVFFKDGIAPGDGRTSLRLPDPLATGRTYYWRARAQDGANTGPYSEAASFNVYTPIVIQAPTLASPVGGTTIDGLRPRFIVNNAARSGPVGAIQYLIELSDSETFANKIGSWVVAEQPNQTTFQAPQDLAYSKQYFWRARAFDPTTVGPFSGTETFKTPAAPAAPPPPPSGGGGGGSGCAPVANDGLPFGQATIYDSPVNLASWCVSARITSVQFTPSAFPVEFDRRTGPNRWPDSPFGDGSGGTIQYTLGLCENIGGSWACSAVVQFWYGRDLEATGPPSQVGINWFYDPNRWGPLHQPAEGETVGIFVCAGNCRASRLGENSVIHERSNVVLVRWTNGFGSYSF